MARLTRKNSNVDQAEITYDKSKVEKTSELVASTSNFKSGELEKVSE